MAFETETVGFGNTFKVVVAALLQPAALYPMTLNVKVLLTLKIENVQVGPEQTL